MTDLPHYDPLPIAPNPAVAKSVANPNAFAKPGSTSVRFRATNEKRGPGRPRKHKRDRRDVIYF